MESMTEEFYFSEYINTGYSQSALVNTYQSFYILSNDTDVMIFGMTEKLPLKLSQKEKSFLKLEILTLNESILA